MRTTAYHDGDPEPDPDDERERWLEDLN